MHQPPFKTWSKHSSLEKMCIDRILKEPQTSRTCYDISSLPQRVGVVVVE